MQSNLYQPEFPIIVQQGADFSLPIQLENEDGTPRDLTGFTGEAQIRPTPEATGAPLANMSSTNGGIVIDALAGTILMFMSANTTMGFPAPWCGFYDLFIFSDTSTEKVLWGPVNIMPRVTK